MTMNKKFLSRLILSDLLIACLIFIVQTGEHIGLVIFVFTYRSLTIIPLVFLMYILDKTVFKKTPKYVFFIIFLLLGLLVISFALSYLLKGGTLNYSGSLALSIRFPLVTYTYLPFIVSIIYSWKYYEK